MGINRDINLYKYSAGLALVTGCLLLIPLIAMQFTDEVAWSAGDFAAAGILLFGTGLAYKLISLNPGKRVYRVALGTALAAGLMLVWVNLAVGFIGSVDHPANMVYPAVLVVGATGALIARFKPKGMAYTLFATALAQALVPVIALLAWPPEVEPWGEAGVYGVFGMNGFFVILFVLSALLFRQAAKQETDTELYRET